MKVYTKVVINIDTMCTIEEDYYYYSGEIGRCKGGGGGGSSGAIDFPAYMKTVHGDWLDRGGVATLAVGESITELVQAGLTASPYTGEVAYDPSAQTNNIFDALDQFDNDLSGVLMYEPNDDWISMFLTVDDEIYNSIEDTATTATAAHAAILDDRLIADVLPRFQVGMRDINSVVSSSFVIGEAVLEAFNTRDVAEFDGKLRHALHTQRLSVVAQGMDSILKVLHTRLAFREALTRATIDGNTKIVIMNKEEQEEQLEIDDKEYRWGLELWQYGGNVLSSISGSAISTQKTPSKGQSVLGGVLSGAAAGGMIGGAPGAALGGIIGGIGGLFG